MSWEVPTMRSRTSFFNGTVFGKNLTRCWPVWAVYALILILFIPLGLLGSVSRPAADPEYALTAAELGRQVLSRATSILPILLDAVCSCAAALAAFGYLYNTKSCAAIAALPLRREGTFLSCCLSGLVWLFGAHVLAALILSVVELCAGLFAARYILLWLIFAGGRILAFYGLACLCAMLTGNGVIMALLYGVLNFLAVGAETLIRSFLSLFIYGYEFTNSGDLGFLSPVYELFRFSSDVYGSEGDPALLSFTGAYAAAGVVMLACALLLYRRRRMEAAGDAVAVRALRPVFKYCMASGCALALGALIYGIVFRSLPLPSVASVAISALIGGFIGYLAAQMLLKKTFRVGRGGWAGFAVFAVILCALIGATSADLFGIQRYIPPAERVESLTVYMHADGNSRLVLTDEGEIRRFEELHSRILQEKAQHTGTAVYPVKFRYSLRDGRTVARSYAVSFENDRGSDASSAAGLLQELWNDPETVARRVVPVPSVTAAGIERAWVDLTGSRKYTGSSLQISYDDGYSQEVLLPGETAAELMNTCILPDIADGTLGVFDFSGREFDPQNGYSVAFVLYNPGEMDYDRDYPRTYVTCRLFVPPQALRTTAMLESLLTN